MSSALPQSRVRVQRIAEAAVERARLTVVPRRRVRAPRVPFVTLVSLLLVAGVVGLLMFNTTMQQNSFQMTSMQAEADRLASEQQSLEMQLDRLRDPQRLGEWARAHGLVQPPAPAFLLLDGTVLGTPTRALVTDDFDPRTPRARKPAELESAPIIVREPAQAQEKSMSDVKSGSDEKSRTGAKARGDAGHPDTTAQAGTRDTDRAPANGQR